MITMVPVFAKIPHGVGVGVTEGVGVGVGVGVGGGVPVAVAVAVGVGDGVPAGPHVPKTLNTMCMFGNPIAAVVVGVAIPQAVALI